MRGMKTGGRKKGSPNKRTLMVQAMADKMKMDPMEILAHFAQGNWKELGYEDDRYILETASGATRISYVITPQMRLQAAEAMLPYLYAKKKEEIPEDPLDVTPESELLVCQEALDFIKKKHPELLK